MHPRNPTLIFGDKHDDPVNIRLLIKMMPQLKAMGYEYYYEEAAPGYINGIECTADDYYAHTVPLISLISLITPIAVRGLKRFLIDADERLYVLNHKSLEDTQKVINEIRILKIVCNGLLEILMRFKIENQYDAISYAKEFTSFSENIPKHVFINHESTYDDSLILDFKNNLTILLDVFQPLLYSWLFYENLHANNINVRCIDDPCAIPLYKNPNIELVHRTLSVRNKTMTEAYLASHSQSVIGKTGLAHVDGIQNEILSKLSLDTAMSQYIFIHIYDHEEADKIASTKYPLGIIAIEEGTKTDDEIIEIIINAIKSKQKLLNQDQPQLTSLRANSVFPASSASSDTTVFLKSPPDLQTLNDIKTEKLNTFTPNNPH